ncbi:MAG TPA: vitamin K epoxide reductase family protein [Aggregatilineaceae bacterium]|nr:vitamin K epoxide reductase family protein [Aggregatilineaceae bacterium]
MTKVRVARQEHETKPWEWERVTMVVLAIVGIFVAGYLSWAEVTGNNTACLNTGAVNCEAVQTSAYSKTLGIPVAVLGLLGYIAILGTVLMEDQLPILAQYGKTLVVVFGLFGVMFSVYLSLIEGTVLDKWCQWCVISAILISILFIIGSVRLWRFMDRLRH